MPDRRATLPVPAPSRARPPAGSAVRDPRAPGGSPGARRGDGSAHQSVGAKRRRKPGSAGVASVPGADGTVTDSRGCPATAPARVGSPACPVSASAGGGGAPRVSPGTDMGACAAATGGGASADAPLHRRPCRSPGRRFGGARRSGDGCSARRLPSLAGTARGETLRGRSRRRSLSGCCDHSGNGFARQRCLRGWQEHCFRCGARRGLGGHGEASYGLLRGNGRVRHRRRGGRHVLNLPRFLAGESL